MDFIVILLLAILRTAATYMAFPLIRMWINMGRFERKKAKKIALWNSVIVGAIYFLATSVLSDKTWNPAPAVVYYWINCALLTEKTKG